MDFGAGFQPLFFGPMYLTYNEVERFLESRDVGDFGIVRLVIIGRTEDGDVFLASVFCKFSEIGQYLF